MDKNTKTKTKILTIVSDICITRGQFVLIDYLQGVNPQIQMKYMRGSKAIIHTASQR